MADKTRVAKRKNQYRQIEKTALKGGRLYNQFRRLNRMIPQRKRKTPLNDMELIGLGEEYKTTLTVVNEMMAEWEHEINEVKKLERKLDELLDYHRNPQKLNELDPDVAATKKAEIQTIPQIRESLAAYAPRMSILNTNITCMTTIRKALSKDLRTIENCIKEKKNPTVIALYEDSRSAHVEFDMSKAKKVGAGISVRYMIGTKNPGVFTISKVHKPEEDKAALKNELKKKYGENANILNDADMEFLIGKLYYDSELCRQMLSVSSIYKVDGADFVGLDGRKSYFKKRLAQLNKDKKLSREDVSRCTRLINRFDNPKQYRAFIDYFSGCVKIQNGVIVNGTAGINKNSKIDKRNSAMSTIAELIGCKNIIARSTNLHVKDTNGKVLLGTFMEKATGMDCESLDDNQMKMFNQLTPMKVERSIQLKKDLANLQIVDWISGNPDRHEANMFYKFDEEGNIVGVMGIDNDTCLGRYRHNLMMNGINLENLMVIPKETADAIAAMDSETLKNMLYGYDLTDAEVKAAEKRFNDLKNKIEADKEYFKDKPMGYVEDGRIKIVSDDELGLLSMTGDLGFGEAQKTKKDSKPQGSKTKNLFGTVVGLASNGHALKEGVQNLKIGAFKDASTFYEICDEMEKRQNEIEEVDRRTYKGSQAFTNMKNALTAYTNYIGFLQMPLIKNNSKPEVSLTQLNEIKKKINETIDVCNIYISGKDANKINKKSKTSNAYLRLKQANDSVASLKRSLKAIDDMLEKKNRAAEYEKDLKRIKKVSAVERDQFIDSSIKTKQKYIDKITENLMKEQKEVEQPKPAPSI